MNLANRRKEMKEVMGDGRHHFPISFFIFHFSLFIFPFQKKNILYLCNENTKKY